MVKVLAILLASVAVCDAATWYASSTGSSTDGTAANPWGVLYAATNTTAQAGDTVIFMGSGPFQTTGTNVTWSVGGILEFPRSGITYRSQNLWQFTFNGGLLLTGTNLTIWGFNITNSVNSARACTNNYHLLAPGITEYGVSNRIMHNLIQDTGHPGIGSWKTTRGKYIAGNIIRFTGFDDWSTGHIGEERGSGMYLQNADDSAEALIQGNISYFNYTTGFKAYGNTDIWKFTFRQNANAENAEAGVFYHLDNYPSTNLIVDRNYLWKNGTSIRIGYLLGNGGHSNAIVSGNYCVETNGSLPFYMVDGWRNTTWTNNTGVNLADRYVWQLEVAGEASGDIASHHINYNTYWGVTNTGSFGGGPFMVNEVRKSFPVWQGDVHGDTNSTYTDGRPASLVSFVFQPSTDTSFVHVVVFNWPTNSSTTVDLSSYFTAGARLAIYDAQDIPNAYTNLTFSGSTVTLDLTRTNRATMLGTFSQRSDTWQGFDQRFRAFVIYATPVATLGTVTATTLIWPAAQ